MKSQHPAESKPTTSPLDGMSSTAVLQSLQNADSCINGFFHWSHQKGKTKQNIKRQKSPERLIRDSLRQELLNYLAEIKKRRKSEFKWNTMGWVPGKLFAIWLKVI